MALEGSLKEFNVADILQLIFFQKKTGVLYLQGRTERLRVLFFNGNIVAAESKKSSSEKRLIWILVKRGLLSQQQLDSALEKQKAEGGKLAVTIVREGFITKEALQAIMTFQIQEIMVRVFSMREGRYEFKPQSIPVDKEIGVVLNTEHFLMEGVRMVDEWSEIESRISVDDLFFRNDDYDGEPEGDEVRVMNLVNGEHDIVDITDISGMDSFTVSSIMLRLEEKGMVYRQSAEAAVTVEPVRKVRQIPGLNVFLMILVLCAFVASFYTFTLKNKAIMIHQASEQMDALRLDIRTAYYLEGDFPESIEATDPWGNGYYYLVEDGTFVLASAGPDGKMGTADDIR